MRIRVNGEERETGASTLAELVEELELTEMAVATAHNQIFAPKDSRAAIALQEGDEVEIVSPRQGG